MNECGGSEAMKMKKPLKLLSLLCFFLTHAQAQVVVDVSGAQRSAELIAVLPVQGDSGGEMGKMDYIISGDLFKSGLFQPLDPSLFPNPANPAQIDYQPFKAASADYVVLGRLLNDKSAQFVLSQIGNQQVVFNKEVSGANTRAIAHQTADLILQELTGIRGAFGTRIAYVLEQRGKGGRRYALVVSDTDGANRQEIFSNNKPILSPAWSPDGQRLAYMTYANNHAQIVVQNANGGARRVLVQTETTSSAPSWSPDGATIAISRADEKGNMDIYAVDVGSGAQRRLTNQSSIDTEPTFSPDGRYIYFTSDRMGSPQIYRMNRDGSGVERAVVGGNYSSNSELAPDGKHLALTRQSGGGYQVGLYNMETGRFQALTNGRLDEGATFAPNGQLLLYTANENGRTVLKMINLKGTVVQTLSDPTGYLRDPAWAPDTRK